VLVICRYHLCFDIIVRLLKANKVFASESYDLNRQNKWETCIKNDLLNVTHSENGRGKEKEPLCLVLSFLSQSAGTQLLSFDIISLSCI